SKVVKFCAGARSYYRSGLPGSLSGSRSEKAWHSAFRVLELNCDNLLAKENSDRTRKACAAAFQQFIYQVYPEVPDLRDRAEQRVERLGNVSLPPSGGPLFHLLVSTVGWKAAKRLQRFFYQHGYVRLRSSSGWFKG
ncbi:MAG TPA: glycosyltransferase family 2 protein, partial [Blastocatellia bacterium]|nr:glycosyltransferase family 2 protein [Blastocatellia bacterium]